MTTWMIAALLWGGTARADGPYLASDEVATQEAAQTLAERAAQAGCPGEVRERYVEGRGWRWSFQGSPGADVRACLVALGEEADRFHTVTGAAGSRPAAPASAEEIVRRLERAHAGTRRGPVGRETLIFRFVRELRDGSRVRHVFARRGDDRYLEVEVIEGEGTSSRSGVAGGVAWLEGADDELDAERVRASLDRFSPAAVLRVAAQLAAGELDLSTRESLHVTEARVPGRVAVAREATREASAVRLEVDATTWRLHEAVLGEPGAEVTWRFEGWRELSDGALVPQHVEVRRGATLLDAVEVEELDLAPTLPDVWFTPPEAAPEG